MRIEQLIDFGNRTIIADHETIYFPKGVHQVYPGRLHEDYRFVSNNDTSLKRLWIDLDGCRNVVIDGQGAELVMHGRIIPFYLRNAQNIVLKNFTLDWSRQFVSPARVIAVGDGWVDVKFGPEYPVDVKSGKLHFTGSHYYSNQIMNVLEFDADRMETAWKARDCHDFNETYRAELKNDGSIRIHYNFITVPRNGNFLAIAHEPRLSPAIVIDMCKDVRLENITIHHCSGMGVIAQCSSNIVLDKVDIKRRPGSTNPVSICADASHFVDCDGRITIQNCLFENQMDDSCNIHGIYRPVTRQLTSNSLEIALIHQQQLGIETIRPGDNVGFYSRSNFKLLFEAKAEQVARLNCEYSEIVFPEILPDVEWSDIAVMRKNHNVNVYIANNIFRNNRARSLLISTLGKVLIENNYFHVPGSAMIFAGDNNYWYESGPVEDVEVRNNLLDNCGYGVWGNALFSFIPEIEPKHRQFPFHRNVRIHHNKIKVLEYPVVYARCVDGLAYFDNEIISEHNYPVAPPKGEQLLFDGCVNAVTELQPA